MEYSSQLWADICITQKNIASEIGNNSWFAKYQRKHKNIHGPIQNNEKQKLQYYYEHFPLLYWIYNPEYYPSLTLWISTSEIVRDKQQETFFNTRVRTKGG